MTRQTGRSVISRRDTRRSVTPACRGRVGVRPLVHLEEETPQEVEAVREYELDLFENQIEPQCQADMLPVRFMDKDDPNPGVPWASRLEVAELIELARPKRIELGIVSPRKPGKDGWMGPVPPKAGDPAGTLLHNVRWWFFPCRQRRDAPLPLGRRHRQLERSFWLFPMIRSTSCSVMIPCTRLFLDWTTTRR